MLRHEFTTASRCVMHASVMGIELTGQQGEECALAAAIGTDKADAITAADAEVDAVKQGQVSCRHVQGMGTHQGCHALAL